MKRLFRHLKPKRTKDVDSDDSDDSYKPWWETESFRQEFKAEKTHSKDIVKCRKQLQAEVQAGVSQPIHALLQDVGGTGGRDARELALQNLVLNKSSLFLHLGQFNKAHSFLEALETPEQLPATYFFRSQIYNAQGYRKQAAKQLQLALNILPHPAQDAEKHARFHDLLKARMACTTLDDWKSSELPDQGPQACTALSHEIWGKWLRDIPSSNYDPVAILLLDLYLDVVINDQETMQGAVIPLLDAVVSNLVSQSRIAEAFTLFTLRCECSDPSWDQHLSFLPHLKRTRAEIAPAIPCFTAELQLRKARWIHLNRPTQKKLCNQLLQSAEKTYKKCGHAWGYLDVQKFKLFMLDDHSFLLRMGSMEDFISKTVERLSSLVEAYAEVDYPSRQIDTMDTVLDIFAKLSHADGIYTAQKYLRDVCRATGRSRRYWGHHLMVMAAEVGQSTDIGSFLQDCLECPPAIINCGDPSIPVLRLKIMFYVSYRMGDVEKVLDYGPSYIQALETYDKHQDASDVAEMVAGAQLVFDPDNPQKQLVKFQSGQNLLRTWIVNDISWYGQDKAASKLILLAKAKVDFRSVLPNAIEEAEAVLEESTKLAQQFIQRCRQNGVSKQETREYEATYFVEKADVEALILEVTTRWDKAIECGEVAIRKYGTIATAEATAALKLHHGRRKILRCTQQSALSNETQRLASLQDAKKRLGEALTVYTPVSRLAEIVECKYWEAVATKNLSEPSEAADILRSAVHILNYLLDDAPASSAIAVSSLQYKHFIVTGRDVRRIFALGLEIATSHNEPAAAWEWVQHSKARSLSDMLRLNTMQQRTPEKFLDDLDWACRDLPFIELSLDSMTVVAKMTSLLKALRTAPVEQRGFLKREVQRLKQGMRQDTVLQGSLSVLTGAPATLDDLRWLCMASSERPIFLDWAAVGDTLYLIRVEMVDAGIWPPQVYPKVTMHKLGITMTEVEEWKYSGSDGNRYLDRTELSGEDAYDNLNMLKELIAPIAELSKEGNILILCPTGAMHGIPLHAIEISANSDGESVVLLERNPVVYTYSLSVLRQCVARSKSNVEGFRPKAAFFGVFEGRGPRDEEPDQIKACLDSLATKFHSSVSFGAQVTDNEFRSRIADATTVIHFHGHTRDKVTALEQSLVLADHHAFDAKSVFELELSHAPLVTLIACASVDQTTMPGDEPLGILSAFLYSGAGSTVGTLWPTRSRDGRTFSEAFYDNFFKFMTRKSDTNVSVVSVARALQQAALSIKGNDNTNAPYHWAQFVLYGSWFRMMRS